MIEQIKGIKFDIYDNDHAPPHYHAKYNDEEVLISIDTLTVLKGNMNPVKLREAIKWGKKNQELLKIDFNTKNPPTHQK